MEARTTVSVRKLGWSLAEIEVATGLSRSLLYRMMAAGELTTIKVRGRRLVPAWQAERLLQTAEHPEHTAVLSTSPASPWDALNAQWQPFRREANLYVIPKGTRLRAIALPSNATVQCEPIERRKPRTDE